MAEEGRHVVLVDVEVVVHVRSCISHLKQLNAKINVIYVTKKYMHACESDIRS